MLNTQSTSLPVIDYLNTIYLLNKNKRTTNLARYDKFNNKHSVEPEPTNLRIFDSTTPKKTIVGCQ